MKKITLAILILGAASLLPLATGCSHAGSTDQEETGAVSEEIALSGQEVVITREQFEGANMSVGIIEEKEFHHDIRAGGYVVPAPGSLASISSNLPGRIKSILVNSGTHVKAGTRLFSLEGNEVIGLQQDYAEALSQLVLLKSNFERYSVLAAEQISAGKELVKAESEYRALQARTAGLEARLKLINIDPQKVSRGIIMPEAYIVSPIEGVVSNFKLVMGGYIEPGEPVLEIIDLSGMQLEIELYEKDLVLIKEGQKVSYKIPGNGPATCKATLISIDKSIDPETRTLKGVCRPDAACSNVFAAGSYVEVIVTISSKVAPALPSSAIAMMDDESYVLELESSDDDKFIFRWKRVKTGEMFNEYTEVTDIEGGEFLTSGVYNLSGI